MDADGYGKATYILAYKKVTKQRTVTGPDGQPRQEAYTTVTVSKCVQDTYIYEEIDTGLTIILLPGSPGTVRKINTTDARPVPKY